MAYYYTFYNDENILYCMPISFMYEPFHNARKITINKEDYIVPRKSQPSIYKGRVFCVTHTLPKTVYRRSFWMEERDDEKAEEIKNRYLKAMAKKKENDCPYCNDSCTDIFFSWLPAMFGLEKEDHDYNPDVTVFITDNNKLELSVMMGDDYLVKDIKKINFCPFCGRRLHND